MSSDATCRRLAQPARPYTADAGPGTAGSPATARQHLRLAGAGIAFGRTGRAMNESDFQSLLDRVQASEPGAWDELMRLVYVDLKRIAHGQMARIAPGQTLSTTVLVHEAFEKLASQGGLPVQRRSDFYGLCAYAMRQIIIDHYRKRSAEKRAPDIMALAEHESRRVTPDIDNALIDLGRALDLLSRHDERLLRAFEMRYFGGLSDAEIAGLLALSERSVQRLVARARAWVAAALDAPG